MKDKYLETHKTWDNIAQLYEEKFMELDLYNDTYKSFCDLLTKPDASILEIGCGPGNITRRILNLKPKLKVLATDVSKNMIDLTKRNNPEVEVQVLDCRNLNTIKSKFDGVVCGFTIPYLSKHDCSKLISNCCNLLPDKGVLYISFVPGDYNESGFVSGGSGDKTYFYYHEINRIKKELELNKMTVVGFFEKEYKRSDTISETHIIVNAQKNCI